jgi:hypothetical protein
MRRTTVIKQFWRWRAMRCRLAALYEHLKWEREHRPFYEWQATALLAAEIERDFDEATLVLQSQHPRLSTALGYLVYPELL